MGLWGRTFAFVEGDFDSGDSSSATGVCVAFCCVSGSS